MQDVWGIEARSYTTQRRTVERAREAYECDCSAKGHEADWDGLDATLRYMWFMQIQAFDDQALDLQTATSDDAGLTRH